MPEQEPGEIRAEVTVTGDVSGQLAVGENIVQMRVDRVLGNVVTVLPPGATPNITARPHPLRLLPRPPTAVFDRVDETQAAVAELAAHRSVALQASPGMGKSTMVQHLAHHPDIAAAYGAVVHVSARGQSRDDLLQAIFEAFYTSDVPVRPTQVQLRHFLQPMHAAVLLDDVDLPDDAVTALQELAPSCGFVLAGARAAPWAGARSLRLAGLPPEAAGQLLAHVLGHAVAPADQYALWGLTRGAPARLVQLGVTATTYPGPLASFVQWAAQEGLPSFRVDSPEDRRLLGLLAAVPGVELTAQQLAEISGVPDAAWRLREWAGRGVLAVSAAASRSRAVARSPRQSAPVPSWCSAIASAAWSPRARAASSVDCRLARQASQRPPNAYATSSSNPNAMTARQARRRRAVSCSTLTGSADPPATSTVSGCRRAHVAA